MVCISNCLSLVTLKNITLTQDYLIKYFPNPNKYKYHYGVD